VIVSDYGTERTPNALLEWCDRMALHHARQTHPERIRRWPQKV